MTREYSDDDDDDVDSCRNDDLDVIKWIKRLERTLKAIPEGVTLYGMERNLFLVDVDVYEAIRDADPDAWLADLQCKRLDALTMVTTGRAYSDSGGF